MAKNNYCFFIDESGSATPNNFKQSSYFTLCGVLIGERSRAKLLKEFNELKVKYFGRKGFVIHQVSLRSDLKHKRKKEEAFASDLRKVLARNSFYVLFVSVDKYKAHNQSWIQSTVYKRTYNIFVANLVKFLIAKKINGKMYAEASSHTQDMYLYKSLFHYLANGIKKLGIKPADVKKHLTSLSFVTKINNDPEEQLADLFGICGKIQHEIDKGEIAEDFLDAIDRVIYDSMQRKLFKISNATKLSKRKLYKSIKPFYKLPETKKAG